MSDQTHSTLTSRSAGPARAAARVLIVGAGPVGLVLAIELARRGVPLRLIDRLAQPTTESRAVVVHARSLEMLEALGVVEELIASGQKTTAAEFHGDGKTLARIPLTGLGTRYSFSVTTPQTETERILTARLTALGVSVERGTTLFGLDQDARGVRARVKRADGEEETIDADWLVGTDGSHSSVRGAIGQRLDGSFEGQRFLMGDVEAGHDLDHGTMQLFFSTRAGPGMVFPMRGRRARVIAEITDDPDSTRPASLEWLRQVVAERRLGVQIESAHWLTTFEIHHAQVDRYRVGRAFLAGDAAHVHSPAGGQGMNTGMQDAFNLGWKLALVASGAARDELLDSYHQERHPIAAAVIATTTAITKFGTAETRFQREVRNHLLRAASELPFVRHRLANETEELTVAYRDSPIVRGGRPGPVEAGDAAPDVAEVGLWRLLCRDGAGTDGNHVVLRVADAEGQLPTPPPLLGTRTVIVAAVPADGADVVRDPQRKVAAAFGLGRGGGLVVIRPDGYVGTIGDGDDPAPVRGYFERVLDGLR
jgi:2-polyprenyl-6-methoxyphenol hydroxylase-like FAD-dependent oxidoreductase